MVLFCNDHYSLVCELNNVHFHVSWYYYCTVIIHFIHKKYSGTTIVFWTFTILVPWYFWKYFGTQFKVIKISFIMPKRHGISIVHV